MSRYLIAFLFLASCAQKPEITAKSILYQPSTLILEAGKPVETANGVYTPQFKEVWFPIKKVEELEKQLSQF